MKLIKTITSAVTIISILVSSGCATLFRGSKDTISIRSEESDAKIYIDEEYVGKGSAVHMVPKKGEHVIRVSKQGCSDVVRPIPYSFDATTLLGLFLDLGIVSILVVDGLATGATSSASQTNFVLTPECKRASTSKSQ